jgi:cell division protease FtsH
VKKLHKKLYIFWIDHWLKMVITFVVVAMIGLSIWGLNSMESFYRNMTLAQIPLQLLLGAVHALLFVWLYMSVFRGGFSQMKKDKIKANTVNVKFSDVVGCDEAKEEAMEVVHLISDHARVKAIGGKIIRGLLMIGPPGCGKTLLAKAIAAEAKIPFISVAGSEFVEVFVGVGASRVRKLFKRARRMAFSDGACIVFIDELDVIGRQRSFTMFGGGSETNSTQNQLLVEMDGLGNKKENVIVIGATNSAESILDPALLRPGRFDRKIMIDRPYAEGRKKLFEFYLQKVKFDNSIDTKRLANYTVGKSPADIENVVKEAALIATREKRDIVNYADITEALERVDLGMKRKRNIVPQEKENTAYHESGHAIVLYYLHPLDDVFKLSIATRSETLGVCHHQPLEEVVGKNREWFLANIQAALGGYTAEKLRFKHTTSGVSADFRNATHLAHTMVWKLGMGVNGSTLGDYSMEMAAGDSGLEHLSDALKARLNRETDTILKECYQTVDELLKKESVLLDELAKALLAKEELEYDEIDKICQTYGKTGERRIEFEGVLQRFRKSYYGEKSDEPEKEPDASK